MPNTQLLRSSDRLTAWASAAALLLAACSVEKASDGLDPGSDSVPRSELVEGDPEPPRAPSSTEVQAAQAAEASRPNTNLLTDPTVPSDFLRIAKRLDALYGPEAELRGQSLSFLLTDADSGAWANATETHWEMRVSRKLLLERLPNDVVSTILCHEIGHLVGGFPFRFDEPGRPLPDGTAEANEGQADYFTTKDCLPRLWAAEHKQNADFRRRVRRAVRQQCDVVWNDVQAQNLCYRSAHAAEAFGAWQTSRHGGKTPDLLTPDTSTRENTWDAHPDAQCRIDTLFQGALCPKRNPPGVIPGIVGDRIAVDAEQIAAKYSCTSGVGARPACWFVANEPSHDCSSVPRFPVCTTEDGTLGTWLCSKLSGPEFIPCEEGDACDNGTCWPEKSGG